MVGATCDYRSSFFEKMQMKYLWDYQFLNSVLSKKMLEKGYTINGVGYSRYKLFKPILWILKTLGFKGRRHSYILYEKEGELRHICINRGIYVYGMTIYYPDPGRQKDTETIYICNTIRKFNDPIFVSLIFKLYL